MKLNGTTIFVVGKDGVTEMNLTMLVDAVNGGLKLGETPVFTTSAEAADELRRRQLVYAGINTLQRLAIEDLEVLVPQLEKDALDRSVDRTMEKVLG